MPIDIELLLAGHPLLFLGRECGVKDFDSGGVLTAVGGGGGDIHPLPAVKRAGDKLCHEQGRRKVAVHHKADVLLLAAHKPRLT